MGDMIFNTQEGPTLDQWDPEDLHVHGQATVEQQQEGLALQLEIAKEKLKIKKFELETLGIPQDTLGATTYEAMLKNIDLQIAKIDQSLEQLKEAR